VGKSGVLENKSGNISETRYDRGKVTMEGLYEVTNALSVFWVAAIFPLPVSPLRLVGRLICSDAWWSHVT